MQLLGIAFAAWLGSQLVKFSLQAFQGAPSFRLFYQSGGMPSAHAATVTAVVIAALMLEGIHSPVFGLAAVFAAIVIYDTLGVRRSAGEQSIAINALAASFDNPRPIREVLGHTPREVLAGIGFGGLVGLLFTHTVWSSEIAWLAASPGSTERFVYLGVFAALVVAGSALRFVLTRYRKVTVIRRLVGAIWWWFMLPGVLGLFLALLQYQSVGSASWRIWVIIVLITTVFAHVQLYFHLYRGIGATYQQQVAELKQRRRQQRKKKSQKSKTARKRK